MTTAKKPNDCPELGTLKATTHGDVCLTCAECGFVELLPDNASLDHVVLGEIHHIEFDRDAHPTATEPGS